MSSTKSHLAYSHELKKNIAQNIRKFRKLRCMTQEQLAEVADISYDFLRRIETTNGKCGVSITTLYKLALALDVSLDDLVGRDIRIVIDLDNLDK